MRACFYILLCFSSTFLLAQDGPLWETSWRNANFIERFKGSYGFDGPREPTISKPEQQLFEEVGTLYEQNNVPGAIDRVQSSITPQSSAALDYILGNLYYEGGQIRNAVAAYQSALEKFPGFVRAKKNLGLSLMQDGRYADARPLLIEVIEQDGADSTVYGMLAFGYFNEGMYASALQAYQNALLMNPESMESQIGRAQSLYALERHKEAAAAYDEILRIKPERKDLWVLQANTWLALDKPDRAAANIEVVRRLGNPSPEAMLLLGNIYLRQGLPVLAKNVYAEAMSADRRPSEVESLRAVRWLVDDAAWDEAEQLLDTFQASYGALSKERTAQLLTLRAQVSLAQGESSKAAEVLRRLLDTDPMNGTALMLLAQYEWEQEQYEEAELLFERASRLPEFEVESLVQKARMRVAQQDYSSAVMLLRKAQLIRPQENVARYLESVERVSNSQVN